jgi:hypothetical protein
MMLPWKLLAPLLNILFLGSACGSMAVA